MIWSVPKDKEWTSWVRFFCCCHLTTCLKYKQKIRAYKTVIAIHLILHLMSCAMSLWALQHAVFTYRKSGHFNIKLRPGVRKYRHLNIDKIKMHDVDDDDINWIKANHYKKVCFVLDFVRLCVCVCVWVMACLCDPFFLIQFF